MILKMPTHCGDDTCSSCVVAGDFIFLAHHGGGQDIQDIVHQTRATIESIAHTLSTVGATLDDIVQLNFYIKNVYAGYWRSVMNIAIENKESELLKEAYRELKKNENPNINDKIKYFSIISKPKMWFFKVIRKFNAILNKGN